MKEEIIQNFEKQTGYRLNLNQSQEVERLVFEIKKISGNSITSIMNRAIKRSQAAKKTGKNKFFSFKGYLLKERYPLSWNQINLKNEKIFLNKTMLPLKNNWKPKLKFTPLKIFFETGTEKSFLAQRIFKKFPGCKAENIFSLSQFIKENKFTPAELKKPFLFIINEKHDFLKPCPCTKNHLSCNYKILNLGFGCPFDCSYCYLQQYSNFSGIIIPANLNDFFCQLDYFEKNLKTPLRIGNGEFSDSLALDHLTEYSLQLMPYLKNKKFIFEFKTKSSNIKNILSNKPSPNIVISWSLNPASIIKSDEKKSACLASRLSAANRAQEAGFRLGFHFDPVIYQKNWETEYKNLVAELYQKVKPPFAWISLGSLRCNRRLKSVSEQRFPKSKIFYGELFLGKDNKLRYPKFIRLEIYKKLFGWIRHFDSKTPVYLCMESPDIWKEINKFAAIKKQTPLNFRF